MPTDLLIKHCSPTLAGIKLGNLVSHCFENLEYFYNELENKNRILNPKGIYLLVLKVSNNKALIYVYRKSQLEERLKDKDVRKFLKENCYNEFDLNSCFNVLKQHLLKKDFPHEIGVFLGYPLADIKAFIENKGANFKVVGCWKSYFNEHEATKTFEKYKKCTRVYCEKFSQGFDVTRLAVAV